MRGKVLFTGYPVSLALIKEDYIKGRLDLGCKGHRTDRGHFRQRKIYAKPSQK